MFKDSAERDEQTNAYQPYVIHMDKKYAHCSKHTTNKSAHKLSFSLRYRKTHLTPSSLKGSHNVAVAEVLVMVQVQGVWTRFSTSPPPEAGAVEAQVQVLGERHVPGVCADGHHWSHLWDNFAALIKCYLGIVWLFQGCLTSQ